MPLLQIKKTKRPSELIIFNYIIPFPADFTSIMGIPVSRCSRLSPVWACSARVVFELRTGCGERGKGALGRAL